MGKYQDMDKADLDAGRPLRYHTPAIKAEKAKAKKREMAKKMKGNVRSEGGIPFGKAPKGEK